MTIKERREKDLINDPWAKLIIAWGNELIRRRDKLIKKYTKK